MRIKQFGIFGAALAASLVWAVPAAAQDPVAAAPQAFKEKLNNDQVRVMEYSSKPGDKEAMHSHGRTVLYVLSGGRNRHTFPDGKTKEVEYKAGDTLWREPVSHSVENVGKTEIRMILMELK
jgi:beta-alanine degradation protein BauB